MRGAAVRDLLREDPHLGATVEARDDHAGAALVEERDGERLIAAAVLERVEADDTDLLEGASRRCLELALEGVQGLQTAAQLLDPRGLAGGDLIEPGGPAVAQDPPQQ